MTMTMATAEAGAEAWNSGVAMEEAAVSDMQDMADIRRRATSAPPTRYPVNRSDEMAMLQAEANAMKASLESIQNRIADLEKEASE